MAGYELKSGEVKDLTLVYSRNRQSDDKQALKSARDELMMVTKSKLGEKVVYGLRTVNKDADSGNTSSKTIGIRLYISGKMYDIPSYLFKTLESRNGRGFIPSYTNPVTGSSQYFRVYPLTYKDSQRSILVTNLERCRYKGVLMRARALESIEVAEYVLNAFHGDLNIDPMELEHMEFQERKKLQLVAPLVVEQEVKPIVEPVAEVTKPVVDNILVTILEELQRHTVIQTEILSLLRGNEKVVAPAPLAPSTIIIPQSDENKLPSKQVNLEGLSGVFMKQVIERYHLLKAPMNQSSNKIARKILEEIYNPSSNFYNLTEAFIKVNGHLYKDATIKYTTIKNWFDTFYLEDGQVYSRKNKDG